VDELKLDKPRTTFCRQMARKALERCGSACPEGWPCDIELAAQSALAGFVVCELRSLPAGVGGIVDLADRSIGVNATHPAERKRLAIAHEIGHVFLSHPQYVFPGKGKQDAILEREANIFAREFLVPRKALLDAFRTCRDLSVLAQRFMVEREVMIYRFRETGLWGQVV
jgi:Zn-dependent peptidase ImmA (M78 family)